MRNVFHVPRRRIDHLMRDVLRADPRNNIVRGSGIRVDGAGKKLKANDVDVRVAGQIEAECLSLCFDAVAGGVVAAGVQRDSVPVVGSRYHSPGASRPLNAPLM